jgi:hypothetical protein
MDTDMTKIQTISPASHPRSEVTSIPPGMENPFPSTSRDWAFRCAATTWSGSRDTLPGKDDLWKNRTIRKKPINRGIPKDRNGIAFIGFPP